MRAHVQGASLSLVDVKGAASLDSTVGAATAVVTWVD